MLKMLFISQLKLFRTKKNYGGSGTALFTIKDELVHEKEKFKAISDELDQTFAEMSGY